MIPLLSACPAPYSTARHLTAAAAEHAVKDQTLTELRKQLAASNDIAVVANARALKAEDIVRAATAATYAAADSSSSAAKAKIRAKEGSTGGSSSAIATTATAAATAAAATAVAATMELSELKQKLEALEKSAAAGADAMKKQLATARPQAALIHA